LKNVEKAYWHALALDTVVKKAISTALFAKIMTIKTHFEIRRHREHFCKHVSNGNTIWKHCATHLKTQFLFCHSVIHIYTKFYKYFYTSGTTSLMNRFTLILKHPIEAFLSKQDHDRYHDSTSIVGYRSSHGQQRQITGMIPGTMYVHNKCAVLGKMGIDFFLCQRYR